MSKDIGYNDLVSNYLTPKPKDVRGLNNTSYLFYRTQLYQKIFSIFNFKNIPDTWDIDFIYDNLFVKGYLGIFNHNGVNYCLDCGFSGINVYRKPTEIIVSNPILGNLNKKIGSECELLYFSYLNGTMYGVESLVKRYALLLSQCDGSLNTTLINSRVAHVFECDNDADVQTVKKIYDEVSQGKPAIYVKKGKNPIEKVSQKDYLNVKNTYIGNDILMTKRTIISEFLTEIGINNANTTKRERLNADEVNANNQEVMCLVSVWLNTMNRCFEKINKMFDLNCSVEFNKEVINTLKKEVVQNV